MKRLKLLFILLFIVATFSGCDKKVTEPESSTSSTNSSGQPMPKFADVENLDGVMATISYEMASPVAGLPAIKLVMGYSQFGKMVNAGTVKVNNNTLGKSTTGGKVFYMSPSAGSVTGLSGVNFNGSYHNWSVSGEGNIPTLSGKVVSPREFRVISPTAKALVSKSKDLTVSWTGGYSSSPEKILIVLISLSNNKTSFVAEELDNNGVYTIPSSKLTGATGNVMLQVVKYRYNSISANNKNYHMVSEIVKTITFKIN